MTEFLWRRGLYGGPDQGMSPKPAPLRPITSTFDNGLLDRLDRHSLGSDKFDGAFNVALLATEQDRHDPDVVLNAGLADVKRHIRELPAHLPDNRLLDLRSRRERKPAAAAESGRGHRKSLY